MTAKYIAVAAAVGVLVFGAGYSVKAATTAEPAGLNAAQQQGTAKYPLIAKQLFLDDPDESLINFSPLRKNLQSYFESNNLEGSLYFEYLPTGTSIRVDGDEQEVAASLIKLPAAMDLYKAAELGKVKLDQKIKLQDSWLDDGYGDLYQKGAGYELTLRDAARIMLERSDNTALKAIAATTAKSLKPDERSLYALDVDITQNPDLTVSISARSYSSFLKCLYFSCYLNNRDSQEVLKYLTQSDFDNRLVAGVDDKSVKVAHKIGVASSVTQSDCGIVYLPNRHYLLCVMVNGQEAESTDKHIAELSRQAYQYMTKQ